MQKTENQLLKEEGLEARLRNKLSPIKNMFGLFQMYCDREDPAMLARIGIVIEKVYEIAKQSQSEMQYLATQTSNSALQTVLKKISPLFVEIENFLTDTGIKSKKKKASDLHDQLVPNESLIEEILQTSTVEA